MKILKNEKKCKNEIKKVEMRKIRKKKKRAKKGEEDMKKKKEQKNVKKIKKSGKCSRKTLEEVLAKIAKIAGKQKEKEDDGQLMSGDRTSRVRARFRTLDYLFSSVYAHKSLEKILGEAHYQRSRRTRSMGANKQVKVVVMKLRQLCKRRITMKARCVRAHIRKFVILILNTSNNEKEKKNADGSPQTVNGALRYANFQSSIIQAKICP
ncbi:hypothetical protein RFI_33902 [Reticulomyxa filosa]|uniref:Uncharacterized protein n=1 Tax=Reticulomyxa filosa TaxID=46433 RepID=X6LNK2_RETFI|nr:hypothetical protein RFI_33902 [Reticulomyxa filosa]|eukprot:ETO03503.1 hypothetical protein RFI_33902 [Reticulomyxa filosa]